MSARASEGFAPSVPAVVRHAPPAKFRDSHVDGERTTVGVPMVGDPTIDPLGGLLGWRQAQYATAMAQRAGLIGQDASGLEARHGGRDLVVFVLAGTNQEVARYTIPAWVMAFDPFRKPLLLVDQREGA